MNTSKSFFYILSLLALIVIIVGFKLWNSGNNYAELKTKRSSKKIIVNKIIKKLAIDELKTADDFLSKKDHDAIKKDLIKKASLIKTNRNLKDKGKVLTPKKKDIFAEFDGWMEEYLTTKEMAPSDSLIEEGIELLTKRREALKLLIRKDPKKAWENSISEWDQRSLPESFQPLLEKFISARGEYSFLKILQPKGSSLPAEKRIFLHGKIAYDVFTYGKGLDVISRTNIPFRGLVIDNLVSMHEDRIKLLRGKNLQNELVLHPERISNPLEENDLSKRVHITLNGLNYSSKRPIEEVKSAVEVGGKIYFESAPDSDQVFDECLCVLNAPGGDSINLGKKIHTADDLVLASPPSIGSKKVLYIRIDFDDHVGEPISVEEATNVIEVKVGDYYKACSYNRLPSFEATVTDTLRMPNPKAYYSINYLISHLDAVELAEDLGYDINSYDLWIVHSDNAFNWIAYGQIEGKRIWLDGLGDRGFLITAHEIGHNLGLWHANFWNTLGKSIIGFGFNEEYGNDFDVMGMRDSPHQGNDLMVAKSHLSTAAKSLLGYLVDSDIHSIAVSGDYQIVAHDKEDIYSFKAAARIGVEGLEYFDEKYFIGFRQLFDNPYFLNGIFLYKGKGNNYRLLDTTPGSILGKDDSTLTIGRTFTDSQNHIHITPTGLGGTTPESIIFTVKLGPFPDNNEPALSLNSSSLNVNIGQVVTLNAISTDLDGDNLSYYWNFDDGNISFNNASTQEKSWAIAGTYAVRCEVSDMKGGLTAKQILITVGSSTKFQISGNIFDSDDSQVVENALVKWGSKITYSDSMGNYVLTNLSTNSNNIEVYKDGFVFVENGFVNPINVGPTRVNHNLTAVQSEISGTVTLDGVNANNVKMLYTGLRYSGHVFTSIDGTYEIKGLVKGPYTIQALYNNSVLSKKVSNLIMPGSITNINFNFNSSTLSGAILDSDSGFGLEGATIYYENDSITSSGTSTLNGAYSIDIITNGTSSINVWAHKNGYALSDSIVVSMPPDQSNVNFSLQKTEYQIQTIEPFAGGNNSSLVAMNSNGDFIGTAEKYTTKIISVPILWKADSNETIEIGSFENGGYAIDINDNRAVIGWGKDSEGNQIYFYWTEEGGMFAIPTPGFTNLVKVNNAGVVIGHYYNESSNTIPFIWSVSDGLIEIGSQEILNGNLVDINDNGEVAGKGYVEGNGTYTLSSFYWSQQTGIINIGSLGTQTIIKSINNRGEIVGESIDTAKNRFAIIWDKIYGIKSLGSIGKVPPSNNSVTNDISSANKINHNGEIIGYGYSATNIKRGFLGNFTDGIVELDVSAEITTSNTLEINDLNYIVGFTNTINETNKATLWRPGHTSKNIISLVDTSINWDLSNIKVNNQCAIGATGYNSNNNTSRAIIMRPVDDLPPFAARDRFTVYKNIPKNLTVKSLDPENKTLTYSIITPPVNGNLSGVGPNYIYTPNLDYEGSDTFTFQTTDAVLNSNVATISLTIIPAVSHIITASSGVNGNITPSGSIMLIEGEDKVFLFSPDSGYQVDDVIVDSSSIGAVSTYTFTNVTADHSISVSFKLGAATTYTVSYNGNSNTGGTVPTDSNSYLNGATVTVLGNTATLVKTGYTFNGWNTATNGSGNAFAPTSSFTMGSSNITLYAQWTALPTYTIVYDGNINTGGSVPIDSNVYLNGATVTVLGNTGNLVRAGYSFDGWNTAYDGSGSSYTPSATLTMGFSNLILYAQWTSLSNLTTIYSGNTNTGGTVPTDYNSYLNGATVTVLGNTGTLVKTGFTFNGWNTAANGGGVSYAPSATFVMGSSNVSLYAQWAALSTYIVSYDGNTNTGGSVPTDANNYLNGAMATVLGNSGTLVKTGFSFNGWNTAANGSGTSYAVASSLTMGSSNVTLFAKWTALPTYSVTYNGNTNTSGSVPTDGNNYLNGATATVLGNSGSLVKTGYSFNGWNTAANGSGSSYAAASSLTIGSSNVTLYAKWTALPIYNVTYNGNTNTGGSVPTDGNNYLNGATATVLGNSGSLVKTGYSFNGWNTAANGSGSSYAAASSLTMGSSNVTLYAKWTALPTYSVTYNGNTNTSGSVPTDGNNYLNGATVTVLTNSGTLVKTGFTFNNWNTAANGSGNSYATAASLTMGSANVTLYAQWIALPTYTVTYNGNTNTSGSVPTDGNNYLNGATVTVLTNSGTLAKSGFTFNNWNTAANGSGTTYATSSSLTMESSNVTLYAQWTALTTYTITASNGSNGTINPSGAIIVTSGFNKTFTMTPNTGYEVDTVTVDGGSAGNVSSYTFSDVTANHTINVSFKIKTYNIISSAGSNGSISPNGSTSANHGSNQTYTITPNSGYAINDVLVDGASQGTITNFTFSTIANNHTIVASFVLVPVTHTITSSSGANGSISPLGSTTVGDGNNLSYTITPNGGYEVDDVKVDGASIGNVTSYNFINVTVDHTISVTFKATVINHTITASNGSNGSISPRGAIIISNGSSKIFKFTPDAGYIVDDILVDGASVGNGPSYTFNNILTNHTIAVSFQLSAVSFTINSSAGANGSITPSGSTIVAINASQNYTITPDSGYTIQSIIVDGASVPTASTFTFNNILSNHTIVASFRLIPMTHTIIASANTGGSISPNGNIIVGDGLNQSFSITPEAGKEILDVLIDGTSVGTPSNYTFSSVTSDHNISVSFKDILITHSIFVNAKSNGNATPNGSITAGASTDLTIMFTPDGGFLIDKVMVDGVNKGAISEYKLTNISSDHVISVFFKSAIITHQITAFSGANGAISPAGLVKVNDKDSQEFTFIPNSEYEIDEVSIDGTNIGSPQSYKFINVTTDHTIDVQYKKIELSSTKEIITFSFQNFNIPAIGEINDDEIIVFVPAGTEIFGLSATFTHTGVEAKVKWVPQISGVSYLDFRSPVDYYITAEDGSTKKYTVIIYENNLENPGQIEIEFAKYSVSETGGEITLKVIRKNGNEGKATVQLETLDLTAQESLDYTQLTTQLIWEDGDDNDKEIKIQILSDDINEDEEAFQVRLFNFIGGNKGGNSLSEIIIRDSNANDDDSDGGDKGDGDNNDNDPQAPNGNDGDTGSGSGGCSYSPNLDTETQNANKIFWLLLFSFIFINAFIRQKKRKIS